MGWNEFTQKKDSSIQWIPEQIVKIGEDFHNQVNDGKVKTTLYKTRWSGLSTESTYLLVTFVMNLLQSCTSRVAGLQTPPSRVVTVSLLCKAYYQAFFRVLIDLIVEFLGLIIKPFDNQTES